MLTSPSLLPSSTDGPAGCTSTGRPIVLLGVTGGIAAYKACEAVRALMRADVRVKVVMTHNATRFVTATTFKALTREEVAVGLFDEPGAPVHHISLAEEAQVFCVVPCTANVLNKLAQGIADDLLTATALATEATLVIAPAMNVHMWRDAATQESLARLRMRGARVVEPQSGYLACGDVGEGRLAEVDAIVAEVLAELRRTSDLRDRRLLVTAGPTREFLDPVRFLSAPSSGRMGFSIAEEAARRGAEVTLVSGPVTLPDPFGVRVVRVTTACEMLEAAQDAFASSDAAVFTAAVADFRPAEQSSHKIKKGRDVSATDGFSLRLVPNPDILATLAAHKDGRYVVGFAAETEGLEAAARAKLVAKSADLIVANDVSAPGIGFASADNEAMLVSESACEQLPRCSKRALAGLILDRVSEALRPGTQAGA
jgi:phosphopantothenoylcysteine decarboxylase/phosphopantothenate--cysteine ligase